MSLIGQYNQNTVGMESSYKKQIIALMSFELTFDFDQNFLKTRGFVYKFKPSRTFFPGFSLRFLDAI